MLTDAAERHHGRVASGKRFDARVRLMQGFTCGLLGIFFVSGCGSDRPDVLSWSGKRSQQGDEVGALISASDSDVLSISAASCERFVVFGSSAATDLIPAPTPELGKRVQEWVDLVHAVGTECTPSAAQSQVLHDIGSLADDIDALVASQIPTR